MSVNMCTGYPQLAFNFSIQLSQKFLRTHAQKFAVKMF